MKPKMNKMISNFREVLDARIFSKGVTLNLSIDIGKKITGAFLAINLAVFSSTALTGCTWLKERFGSSSTVQMQLPKTDAGSTSELVRANGALAGGWGFQAPSSAAGINCYGVFLYAKDLEQGSCVANDGSEMKLSRLYGLYRAGSKIAIEMPKGESRRIGVFGFQSNRTGSTDESVCGRALDGGFDPGDYSQPLMLGSTELNLVPGDNIADISVSIANSKQIVSCSSPSLTAQVWPRGCMAVQKIAYGSSQITVSGTCLESVTAISIKDNTASRETPLEIVKSESVSSKLIARLKSQFLISAGHSYSLLVSTALGQTALPFSIALEPNSVPLAALSTTGAIDGQVPTYDQASGKAIWKSVVGSDPQTSGKIVYLKNGTTRVGVLRNYWRDLYNNQTWLSITPESVALLPKSPTMQNEYSAMVQYRISGVSGSASLSANGAQLLTWLNPDIKETFQYIYLSGPYFANADCTGDIYFFSGSMAIPTLSLSSMFLNQTFPMATGCISTAGNNQQTNCTGLSYKHFELKNMNVVSIAKDLNPDNSSIYTYRSQLQFDSTRADSDPAQGYSCIAVSPWNTNPMPGYRLPDSSTNVTPLDPAKDLPGVITNPQIGY